MSDYQRIVSYLYEYSHGIKGPNVGFAKIEKRQNQLRLYFHVKTNDQPLEYKIYFYRFHHGTMEGTLIDTIRRNDTIVEFKNTYPLIADLNQVDGFLIFHSNDHFFGSEWNDRPITIRNFLPLEQKKSPESEIPETSPDRPVRSETESNNEKVKEPEIPETLPEELIPDEPASEEEISEESESNLAEYIEALQLEKHAKEQDHEKVSLPFDWKEYPSLPLPPSYGLSPCIKIQLEDLASIPDLPDDLPTNGFLLLNYGNYGHLLLAWDPVRKYRYLGVPGIFDNEKSFISKLFGFQEFITVPIRPHKTGNFGYFMLPVQ